MKYRPRNYQDRTRRWIMAERNNACFLSMGLGKTVATLTAFDDLMTGLEVRAMLVVAPIRVIETVWPDECLKWDHLTHLRCSIIRGSPVSRKITVRDRLLDEQKQVKSKPNDAAMAAIAAPADIYLTNYENLPALCLWMHKQKGRPLPWDMVVFDESTKMKAHNARRFRMVKPFLDKFSRVVLLTGSPMPNTYLDLWAQFYLIDQGERLGAPFTSYRSKYFTVNEYTHEVKLRDGAAEKIQAKIKDKVLCLRSEDYIKLPPIVENIIHLELPTAVRAQYETFRAELLLVLKKLSVEAFNAASLSAKCRQLTSGAIYETLADVTQTKRWEAVHDVKLDAVEDVVEEANGESVLVMYEFRHELERLRQRWPKAPWIGGGSKDAEKAIRDWNAGKVRVMLAHPASIGHGLNLQTGGRLMVWTSGTWSYDLYAQTVKRLHRPGQTKPVIIHLLSMRDTIDQAVQATLATKAQGLNALLLAMRSSLEKPVKS